jgi:hypothetical protein
MCKNNTEKQVFLTAKNFILKEMNIALQDNTNKINVYFNMSFNYTVNGRS